MWVPLDQIILPKALLKWATTHYKCATRFKTQYSNTGNAKTATTRLQTTGTPAPTPTLTPIPIPIPIRIAIRIPTPIPNPKQTAIATIDSNASEKLASVTTTTTSTFASATANNTFYVWKEYNQIFVSLVVLSLVSFSSRSLLSLLPTFCKSLSSTTIPIAQFLLRTVILNLPFLMNDIRTKFFYRKRATINNNNNCSCISSSSNSNNNTNTNNSNNLRTLLSSSSSSSSSPPPSLSSSLSSSPTRTLNADIVVSKLLNNNHRTYNNSSKSNKVFLYYTPRDPRLRIFSNQSSFNKHFSISNIVSDTRPPGTTIDWCQCAELIGGCDNISDKNRVRYTDSVGDIDSNWNWSSVSLSVHKEDFNTINVSNNKTNNSSNKINFNINNNSYNYNYNYNCNDYSNNKSGDKFSKSDCDCDYYVERDNKAALPEAADAREIELILALEQNEEQTHKAHCCGFAKEFGLGIKEVQRSRQ